MAEFKINISDPKTRRTYKKDLKDADAEKLVGKKIKETFKGELIDLPGYELQITGGSDSAGFPMRPDLHGSVRKKILLSKGIGFNPKIKGQRKRRTICGNTLSTSIIQINTKVTKAGPKALSKLFAPPAPKGEAKPAEGEAPAEAPKVKEKPEGKVALTEAKPEEKKK